MTLLRKKLTISLPPCSLSDLNDTIHSLRKEQLDKIYVISNVFNDDVQIKD